MGRFPRRGLSFLAFLFLAAACAPSPSQTPASLGPSDGPVVPSGTLRVPPVVQITDGDLSLTFALSSAVVVPGNEVSVAFGARNQGQTAISYPGRCHLDNMFWVDFDTLDIGSVAQGRVWTGAASELKRRISSRLTDIVPLRKSAAGPPERGCDAAGPNAILDPGQAVGSIAVWDGRLANGYPAPPGGYPILGRFYYYASGPLGDVKPVDAQLPIDVLPVDAPASPLEALDAALSDRAFVEWLDEHPSDKWNSYDLHYRAVERRYELTIELLDGEALLVSIESDGRGKVTIKPYRVEVEPS
jgi:hypothetical protein